MPVELSITFLQSSGEVGLRWDADEIGVAYSTFTPPYRGDDLELVIRGLDHLQCATDGLLADDLDRLAALGLPVEHGFLSDQAHEAVGRALFRALTAHPEGARVLSRARDSAADKDVPLALRLHFPRDGVSLAALPWELIWDDEITPFLLRGRHIAECTRHIDLPEPIPPAQLSGGPLRILPVVPHAGAEEADRQEERADRMRAWKELIDQGLVVMLPEVSPATRRAIVDAFQSGPAPDIVHYVGHGAYRNGHGSLILDRDEDGGGWNPTSVSKLLTLFGGVRMVVLSACQAAMAGSLAAGARMFTGVAPALSAAGVPIVVGMQLTVRVDAANRVASVIYRQLAQGKSVQAAVSAARQALYVEEPDGASWYVPALYIRSRETGPAYLVQTGLPSAGPTAAGVAPAEGRPGDTSQAAPPEVNMALLRNLLRQHFNESELRDLCFELSIEYEDLPGQSKADKARELVSYVQRRAMLTDLVALCLMLRPEVVWATAASQAVREHEQRAEAQRREDERQEIEKNRREGGLFYIREPFPDGDPLFPQLNEVLIGDQPPELIIITGLPGSGRTTALKLFYAKRPSSPGLTTEHTAMIYLFVEGQHTMVSVMDAIADALQSLLLRLSYRDERLSQELGSDDFERLAALAEIEEQPRRSLAILSALLKKLRCKILVICLDNLPATVVPEALFMLLKQAVAPNLDKLYLRIAYVSPPPEPFEGWERSSRQSAPHTTRGIHLLDLGWGPQELRDLFYDHVSRESGISEYREQILGLIASPSDLATWIAVFDDEQHRDRIDAALWEKLYNAMSKAREQRPDRDRYRWTLDDWKQARMILAQGEAAQ